MRNHARGFFVRKKMSLHAVCPGGCDECSDFSKDAAGYVASLFDTISINDIIITIYHLLI